MSKIINLKDCKKAHQNNEYQEQAIGIKRTDEFMVAAQILSECIKALPLTQPDNDKLIELIANQVNVAECEAFKQGVDLGVKIIKG